MICLRLFCRAAGRVVLCVLLAASAQAAPRPVVLELFTSNSCSSCPPAYALLREFDARSPVDDVRLILLSQHVDYWNRLGWVDRYSSADFTARQRSYAREVFGSGRVYTPQLVVNGRREMVASRRSEVHAAIARAAHDLRLNVTLTARASEGAGVNLVADIAAQAQDAPASVWFALIQDDVVSRVEAGENGGRTLVENGVVRQLRRVGRLSADAVAKPQRFSAQLSRPHGADMQDLSAAVFVQRDDDRRIIGAAEVSLDARTAAR
ncbi:DUF1223 domain-containing protein [Endozoicomonas sp. G2_2]|uniref:DUF1223 domain-containing protein n=1 Tax=Endozoicomonas sp. G2_2 TaxID=2821092 RepID=UPI001ADC0572|nr:DUF1223 domain-containing protein [Endozoicomonas sp. G2_2]MBO9470566.1 DUF1223 domain-containing protein [Endozoicomonas sp. G2_2]